MEQSVKNIKCIIIDDEQEACDRLERLLIKIPGVEVIAKEKNPETGIKEAIRSFPDIVFIDVEMPGKSGFDVVAEIREKKIFPTFIFVTGYDQYAIKAIRNAAFDFLLKPVDIDELKVAIERFRVEQKEKQKIIVPEKLKVKYLLTEREIEIIKLLLEGKSSQEISEILFISKHTVDTHRRNILEKTGLKSSNELLKLLSDY